MSKQISEVDARAGACRYILVGLLQRLDAKSPGLIDEMLEGVIADCAAIEAKGNLDDSLRMVCDEAKALLKQAGSYKQNQPL